MLSSLDVNEQASAEVPFHSPLHSLDCHIHSVTTHTAESSHYKCSFIFILQFFSPSFPPLSNPNPLLLYSPTNAIPLFPCSFFPFPLIFTDLLGPIDPEDVLLPLAAVAAKLTPSRRSPVTSLTSAPLRQTL